LPIDACILFSGKIPIKNDSSQEGKSIQEPIETFNDAMQVRMKLLFILWKKIKK
jgi:hypothetical protein